METLRSRSTSPCGLGGRQNQVLKRAAVSLGMPTSLASQRAPTLAPILALVDRQNPMLRLATRADAPALDALMKASIAALFPAFYDEQQTASGVVYIGEVDELLIDDGTYFVMEADGDREPVACGGWSRRDKLFRGEASQDGRPRLLDPATSGAGPRDVRARRLGATRPRHPGL